MRGGSIRARKMNVGKPRTLMLASKKTRITARIPVLARKLEDKPNPGKGFSPARFTIARKAPNPTRVRKVGEPMRRGAVALPMAARPTIAGQTIAWQTGALPTAQLLLDGRPREAGCLWWAWLLAFF